MANIDAGSTKTAKIRYKTQRNNLASQKAGKDMSVARVQTVKTYSLTEMASLIAADGSFMDEADLTYVLTRLSVKMQQLLVAGNALDVGGLVTLRPVITGPIEKDGSFNPATNKVRIKATVGNILREIAKDVALEKVGGTVSPDIESIKNTVTFEDDVLFGLTTATVKGKNLGFDASASDEGLFLDAAGMGVEVISATATEINFRLTGEVATETAAVLSFKTRGGDKNLTDPTVITRTVTLKPAE